MSAQASSARVKPTTVRSAILRHHGANTPRPGLTVCWFGGNDSLDRFESRKAMAESHVVSALVAKRAEIAGVIAQIEGQLGQLRANLVT